MSTLAKHGIFTRRELMHDLEVTNDTLTNWEKEHDFPGRSVGKTTFYDVEQIKKWIAAKPKKQG